MAFMANYKPRTPSFFAFIMIATSGCGAMDAGHHRVRSKTKKPWAVERWVSSQSSTAVPDSCQPGTAASVSFRGLPGLILYYRPSGHKRQNGALSSNRPKIGDVISETVDGFIACFPSFFTIHPTTEAIGFLAGGS